MSGHTYANRTSLSRDSPDSDAHFWLVVLLAARPSALSVSQCRRSGERSGQPRHGREPEVMRYLHVRVVPCPRGRQDLRPGGRSARIGTDL